MSRDYRLSVVVVALVATGLAVGSGPVGGSDTADAAAISSVRASDATAAGHSENGSGVHIRSVYPNPVTDGDAGEFVVLSVPSGTDLGTYALADGDATVSLPNRTVGGRVVLSTHPNTTRELVDGPVLALSDSLALANSGEVVRLRRNGRVVDELAYTDAPAAERRRADGGWRALGATSRPVVTGGPGTVTAFVLPDAPAIATDTLASADRRILFAGYSLTDGAVVDELLAAHERNVSVRVLVDASPVGGMARAQARSLDRLTAAGVEVRVLGGERARYEFHHAKYAVVDDRAMVTTENWKHAGLGGNGSRGWGVVTRQPRIVRGLAATFRADADWVDARPWQGYRTGRTFESEPAANATFPTAFSPQSVSVDRTRLLVAPDNAEPAVVGLVENATSSLSIEQVSVGSRRQPFVRATLDAARRGVRVRVLLSSAWYVEEENREMVRWLNERARAENLPLEARLADPRGRYEKIHAKGLVVDGDQVVVGSLNWNNHSARQNREVVLVLEGEEVGAYYQRVFEADWPTPPPLPAGVLAAVLVAVLCAVHVGRRLQFESR